MQTINYPKLDKLRELIGENCIKIKPEHCLSIDEQIIHAKAKGSGDMKKYNLKKIHGWGFKNMAELVSLA